MDRQTTGFKCPGIAKDSTAAGAAGNTALAGTTACSGVGKQLHTLPSHPALGEIQGFS